MCTDPLLSPGGQPEPREECGGGLLSRGEGSMEAHDPDVHAEPRATQASLLLSRPSSWRIQPRASRCSRQCRHRWGVRGGVSNFLSRFDMNNGQHCTLPRETPSSGCWGSKTWGPHSDVVTIKNSSLSLSLCLSFLLSLSLALPEEGGSSIPCQIALISLKMRELGFDGKSGRRKHILPGWLTPDPDHSPERGAPPHQKVFLRTIN